MLDFFTDFEFVRRRVSAMPNALIVADARAPSATDVAQFYTLISSFSTSMSWPHKAKLPLSACVD